MGPLRVLEDIWTPKTSNLLIFFFFFYRKMGHSNLLKMQLSKNGLNNWEFLVLTLLEEVLLELASAMRRHVRGLNSSGKESSADCSKVPRPSSSPFFQKSSAMKDLLRSFPATAYKLWKGIK